MRFPLVWTWGNALEGANRLDSEIEENGYKSNIFIPVALKMRETERTGVVSDSLGLLQIRGAKYICINKLHGWRKSGKVITNFDVYHL